LGVKEPHVAGSLVALALVLTGCVPAGLRLPSTAAPISSPSRPAATWTSVPAPVVREVTVCPQVEVVLVEACIDVNENGCCESDEAPLSGVTVRISVDGRSVSGVTDQDGEARVETCRGRCDCQIQSVDTEPPVGYRKPDPAAGCSSSADAFIPSTASSAGRPTSKPPSTSTPGFWPTGMPTPTPALAAVKLPFPEDEVTCRKNGGTWRPKMLPDCTWCEVSIPTNDGGRLCWDVSECQGSCNPNLTAAASQELEKLLGSGDPLPLMIGTCSAYLRGCGGIGWSLHDGKPEYRPPYE
jgi:hypothetical protein